MLAIGEAISSRQLFLAIHIARLVAMQVSATNAPEGGAKNRETLVANPVTRTAKFRGFVPLATETSLLLGHSRAQRQHSIRPTG